MALMSKLTREQSNELYNRVVREGNPETLRKLCKFDIFFLLSVACRRKDADNDFVYARCREFEQDPDGHLDLWAREHYKMLPLNYIVPTPDGYKKHGDLKPGDWVFGSEGRPTMVTKITDVFYDGECYEIELSDGNKIKCGAQHKWVVEKISSKRIKGAKNQRIGREEIILNTEQIYKHKHFPDNRLSIGTVELQGHNGNLPISSYVLGVWLGDGCSDGSRVTCGFEDADEIEELLMRSGIKCTRAFHSNCVNIRLGTGVRGDRLSSDFCNFLREFNLIGNKHIPILYLRCNVRDRMGLLRGLMDTDGHCDKRGTATFTNINEVLVDDVYELIASLGMNPHKRECKQIVNGKDYKYFQVSFQAYKNEAPFCLKRKIEKCKEGSRKNNRRFIVGCKKILSEPMSCIQVFNSDGIYLIGRDYLKTHNSTIITYAGTIQEVLRDPDITIGIFSHTRPIAKAFLFAIKTTLEENTFLKGLFKDVLYNDPQKESQKWSLDDGLIVKRKSVNPTCTLEAWGLVDGQPTSKHYAIRIYDDVVTLSSVTSPEMIEKTTNGWRVSLSLGSESSGVSRERYIGTRYHANDTYKNIIDTGEVIVREYYPTDLGKNDIDVIGNPVLMTTDALIKRRKKSGPYIYSCQYLQNPNADKVAGFITEWLQYYECLKNNKNWNYYILGDPAGEGKKKNKSKDPDYSVFIVIGMAPDKNYYLVDMVRDRLNLTERTDKLFELIYTWNPKKIGYEQYGKDSDIAHIQFVQEQKGFRFSIEPLAGFMPKTDRIRRLQPIFEAHRFYLPRRLPYITQGKQMVDMVQDFIAKEYIDFPVGSHDDMLDCMSRILDDNLGAVFPKMKEIKSDDGANNPDSKYDVLVGNSPGSKII